LYFDDTFSLNTIYDDKYIEIQKYIKRNIYTKEHAKNHVLKYNNIDIESHLSRS